MNYDFIVAVDDCVRQVTNISDDVRSLQQTILDILFLCNGRSKVTMSDLRSRLNGVLSILDDIEMELGIFQSFVDNSKN